MVKCHAHVEDPERANGRKEIFIFGLSAENVSRLQAGHPIKLDGRTMGIDGDVWIVYGKTELAIAAELGLPLVQ